MQSPAKIFSASHLYIFGLMLMAAALPLSKFLMSISQFILGLAWFMEGNYRERIHAFLKNIPALLLTGVFLLHLAGLLWTTDFEYARNDIRIKAPLFILTFVIATSRPLSQREFGWIMTVFIAAVTVSSVICTAVLYGWVPHPIKEVREASIFISHIRFSLLVCLAIFFTGYFLSAGRLALPVKWGLLLLLVWLVLFLVLMESVTGTGILVAVSLGLLAARVVKVKSPRRRFALIFPAMLSVIILVFFLAGEWKAVNRSYKMDNGRLDRTTSRGNPYEHLPDEKATENGYPVWLYVCRPELESEWMKRSSIRLDSLDARGQEIWHTLIRFLTSKGLRKDAGGIMALTDEEVRSVEKGVTNVNDQELTSFRSRIRKLFWEYKNYSGGGNPGGHSLTQRFEFWRTGAAIFMKYPVVGTGTGDVRKAFDEEYERSGSMLDRKWRLRAHNQFLTMFIAFGIAGGVYFLFTLFSPLFFFPEKRKDYFFLVFLGVAVFSMLAEDTLETQAGVTFFAYFNALLLFGRRATDRRPN